MRLLERLWLFLKFLVNSLFFWQYLPAAFVYSYKRDRAERLYLPKATSESVITPGKLLQAKPTERGAYFYFEQAELELYFLTPDFVRVNWFPGLPAIPYAIACGNWDAVETTLENRGNDWMIASDALKITIGLDGRLTFYHETGQVIREELPPQRQGTRWIHPANLQSAEHIYGLGERASSINLRGAKDTPPTSKTYQMWNYDPGNIYRPGVDPMYICIPVYLGLHNLGSYLIFYENYCRAEFTFSEQAIANFENGSLRYYIAIGEPPQLIERYTQLTGRAPLPPHWTLGYHQSRWGYRTQDKVRQEVNLFQTHDLPLSAIHLDIDCQVKNRAFTIDPKRFPNLRNFIQELAELGVRCIAINNPGIKYSRQSNLFLEGQIINAFCTYPNGELIIAPVWAGKTVFPDFTNPDVRTWWSQQFAYLLKVGIAGVWNDMNEPSVFVIWGDPTLPLVAQHNLEGKKGDHRQAHNLYGLLENQAVYEGMRQYQPQKRPFIVARSGWAGLQRYAWTWTGDIVSTWEALRQTIATIVGLGLSGIPYSGSDIGGFLGNPDAELYLRWFQMATFSMFYRTHCAISVLPRAPWSYGEPYLSIMRRFLQLRYQLMPYFYTLAWEAREKGYPPVRPLFWLDWTNQSLWDVDDAFCLGNALLVCPIMHPKERSRLICLPKGYWYNFWDDAMVEGGTVIELEASLEQIPLLVKAGSILPMEDNEQLTLHLYPPIEGESEGCLYSDAGDGYGESRLDQFYLIRNQQDLELTWKQQGTYDFPYQDVRLQVHGVSVQQAWVDGQEVIMQGQQLPCHSFRQVRFSFED
ncbi:TIM-barrel domain-containing protein [Coleofasciculus sp. G2-EDA-02]|uniref:TIM-barrel domain-containing protein n=1 Tax=Coleofasciculus sp. G2-EDA-02 TaxID=3069529 RepID=UPI0033020E54